MADTRDVIVFDLERYPILNTWGTRLDSVMDLYWGHIDNDRWDHIPQNIAYLRLSAADAITAQTYWGEVRTEKSVYGTDENGLYTDKHKETITQAQFDKTEEVMKAVITLRVQEIFEKRYTALRKNYGELEHATWKDQYEESTAYIADNSTTVKLIDRLATIRGLTTASFAAKVVDKYNAWQTDFFNLAVKEQELVQEIKSCSDIKSINVFLEDKFGIEMSLQQALEYSRATQDGSTNVITRNSEVTWGLQF